MNCNFVRPDVHPSDHRSVLDPKRANHQSHTIDLRLKQNRWQKLTESEETKDLTNHKRKKSSATAIATLLTLDLGTIVLFSLPVDLGVNSRSPCGSEEHQITVVSTLLLL